MQDAATRVPLVLIPPMYMRVRSWVIVLGAVSALAIGWWLRADRPDFLWQLSGQDQARAVEVADAKNRSTPLQAPPANPPGAVASTELNPHGSGASPTSFALHIGGSGPLPRLTDSLELATQIAKAKRGDNDAAYLAARFLGECNLLAIVDASAPSKEEGIDSPMVPPDLAGLRPECKKVPDRYKAMRIGLFEQAAESGNEQAQVAYISEASDILLDPVRVMQDPEAVNRYRERALGFLLAASAKGNVDAMLTLAFSYEQGLLSQSDQVLACAYALAVRNSGLSRGAEGIVDSWRERLSVEDRQRAEALARQIARR
ncbi:hypothetical protein BURK2_02385 [Burkholderiales bacterium]|nr:hypothetical protein BURK2_02385 [Burkholderiales bacterium]